MTHEKIEIFYLFVLKEIKIIIIIIKKKDIYLLMRGRETWGRSFLTVNLYITVGSTFYYTMFTSKALSLN